MPRGKTAQSLALIEACAEILAEIQPASVRAVCYQLFIRKLLPSMATKETKRVSSQLVYAREHGLIPWEWIVDETREIETPYTGFEDPDHFMDSMMAAYKKDRWALQPARLMVWSEKGTMRGVLAPVLEAYGVPFFPVHGFNSATKVHEAAVESQRSAKPLHVLYVGDVDPSGMFMSEVDLLERLARYGAELTFKRLALIDEDIASGELPSFPASDKQGDSRYEWFVTNYGDRCWEVDAISPPVLRARVEAAIRALIDHEAWQRAETAERAEQRSMQAFFRTWKSIAGPVQE